MHNSAAGIHRACFRADIAWRSAGYRGSLREYCDIYERKGCGCAVCDNLFLYHAHDPLRGRYDKAGLRHGNAGVCHRLKRKEIQVQGF